MLLEWATASYDMFRGQSACFRVAQFDLYRRMNDAELVMKPTIEAPKKIIARMVFGHNKATGQRCLSGAHCPSEKLASIAGWSAKSGSASICVRVGRYDVDKNGFPAHSKKSISALNAIFARLAMSAWIVLHAPLLN
jgi:hypothetical protein